MTVRLHGATQLYGIVGWPVRQTKAPQVLTTHLQDARLDAACVPFEVAPDDLGAFVSGWRTVRNLHGLIVTIPHKAAMLAHVDVASARSQRCGSINVVRREGNGALRGDVLDGEAFVAGLRAQGHDVRGRRCALAGAGGAGAAIACALVQAGVASLAVRDTDAARSSALALRLGSDGACVRAVTRFDEPFDLLVNASPVGMGGTDELPFERALLRRGMLVADIVMEPTDTAFLLAARAAGCAVHHGHHLLDAQMSLFDAFFQFSHRLGIGAGTLERAA